jgi:CheY-like chemotaxis protein
MNTDLPVLVVDDSDTQRYILSTWLQRAGFTVVEAATGAAALAIAGSTDFDVVVLDVRLPDMSGLDVSRELKAIDRSAVPSILHVSAIAVDVSDRSQGLDQGADGYLTDPVEPQEFIATVRALQRRAQARRDADRRLTALRRLTAATSLVSLAVGGRRLAGAAAEGVADLVQTPAMVALLGTGDGALHAHCPAPGRPTEVRSTDQAALRRLLPALPAPAGSLGADWAAIAAGAGTPPGAGWTVAPLQRRDGEPVGLYALPAVPVPAPDDLALVRQLVESVAVTHENLRQFAEEHRIAVTLQRSLLPAALPTLAGLRLTARYQASAEQAEVGGDFYDAIELPDGAALVVIGDVQGHSLAAAIVMAELRYALRAYAEDGHPPAELVARLNRLLRRNHPDTIATLCLVRFAPDRASAAVANAGHIPPLLAAGGQAHYLDYGGPLLGVDRPPAAPLVVPFGAGSRLLLITDGLVERRDRDLDIDLTELAADLAAAGPDIDAVGDALMRRAGAGQDDAALVLVEPAP